MFIVKRFTQREKHTAKWGMLSWGNFFMRVVHDWGKYIAVHDQKGTERIRYQYQLAGDPNPSAPKPFCHPVSDAQGNVLTAQSPA